MRHDGLAHRTMMSRGYLGIYLEQVISRLFFFFLAQTNVSWRLQAPFCLSHFWTF